MYAHPQTHTHIHTHRVTESGSLQTATLDRSRQAFYLDFHAEKKGRFAPHPVVQSKLPFSSPTERRKVRPIPWHRIPYPLHSLGSSADWEQCRVSHDRWGQRTNMSLFLDDLGTGGCHSPHCQCTAGHSCQGDACWHHAAAHTVTVVMGRWWWWWWIWWCTLLCLQHSRARLAVNFFKLKTQNKQQYSVRNNTAQNVNV